MSYDKTNADFEYILHPKILKEIKSYDLASDELKKLYFKDNSISQLNSSKLIDLIGDMYFNLGIHKVVKSQARYSNAPIYMYKFTYDEGFTLSKAILMSTIPGEFK